jgi:hypothetical protein
MYYDFFYFEPKHALVEVVSQLQNDLHSQNSSIAQSMAEIGTSLTRIQN